MLDLANNVQTIWEPIPGSSQELAIDTRCHHTLYHGTRGPGKTASQIMRFRRRVGQGYGPYWRGVIFDREFGDLSDLVAQSNKVFPKFNDGARWLASPNQYKWVWPTGEELLFRHIKTIGDYSKFHGHEYPFIGWNELTKYPTQEIYLQMMSVNRSSFLPEKHTPTEVIDGEIVYATSDRKPLPDIPLEVFSTTNPNGPGHNWVKRVFIDVAAPGEVVRKTFNVFNPKTQQDEDVIRTQVSIFGSYRENIYLDPAYIAGLNELTANNPNLKAAWLYGDWTVNAGGALDDLWLDKIHVIDRFKIPKEWFIDRSFDWGSTSPFSVGWWAESNGEELKPEKGEDELPYFPKGTLIRIEEWYGTAGDATNVGIKMSAKDIAIGVKKYEIGLMKKWIERQPAPGPADNQIRDVRESDVETIEDKMADEGVRWTRSDKSPGSRINGLQLMRDRLAASVKREGPGIYFFRNCQAAISTIPALPRDPDKPDDIDTDAEDHCYDEVRYRVLASYNRIATKIPLKYPHSGI